MSFIFDDHLSLIRVESNPVNKIHLVFDWIDQMEHIKHADQPSISDLIVKSQTLKDEAVTLSNEIISTLSYLSLEQFKEVAKHLNNDSNLHKDIAKKLLLPYYTMLAVNFLEKKQVVYLNNFRKIIDIFSVPNLSDFDFCCLLNAYLSGETLKTDPSQYTKNIGISFCFQYTFSTELENIANSPIKNVAKMMSTVLRAKEDCQSKGKKYNFDFLLIAILVLLSKDDFKLLDKLNPYYEGLIVYFLEELRDMERLPYYNQIIFRNKKLDNLSNDIFLKCS